MVALFRLLSHFPLAVLHALGAWLGWLVFLVAPTYRRRFIANARQAGYGFAQVRAGVAHAGRMVAELPRLWLGAPVPVEWRNAQAIDDAVAAGRGVLLLTPHLGSFEVAARAFAYRHAAAHGPITVLFRPPRKAWLDPLVRAARGREGMQAVPTSLSGVRRMLQALRQGRAVGLLPDQVPPDGLGVWAPFFGRPAYTMTLAARLALQTGCAVRYAWAERLPRGRGFLVHCHEPLAPLPDTLEAAVAQINTEMERLIRACPQQYLWSYARYKAPRLAAQARPQEGAA